MPTVVPVKFKYAARDLWFDPEDVEIAGGDYAICRTERGTEIGLVTGDPQVVTDEYQKSICGDAALKPVLRVATDEDLALADELADRGEEALPVFRKLVSDSGLDMKPVGVEYLFGGEKAVCYFSAEDRVDFRQLVRDMARELQMRIDMRQIGVREEAAIVGGFAHCGQELCCARFGRQFEPVSIRMAKEQDLPLNSTKISGACGRLMCCLRYEFEAYRDFKTRAPKKNAIIETPLGKARIQEYDTPKEQLTLRLENGKQLRVALADMETSEAAVKKSEELNCPCRPDTAPRAALERLASPEVQLALAELDREMEVVDDSFGMDDIFVEPKPRKRRSRATAASEPRQADAQDQASEGTSSTRSRRRRKKRGEAAAPEAAGMQPAQGQVVRASRRSHAAEEATAADAATTRTRHRRRHHSTEEAAAQPKQEQTRATRAQNANTAANKPAKQEKPARPERRRRRPGDKGGAAAQGGAAEKQNSPAPQPKHQAQPEQGNDSAENAPKRRRRHRGGRGRGKGGSDAQGASNQANNA